MRVRRGRHSPHAADTYRGVVCAAQRAKSGPTKQSRRGKSVDLTRLRASWQQLDLLIAVSNPFGIPLNYLTVSNGGPTHCIVGWDVVWERTTDVMQAMLDRSPQAVQYYSDEFSTYHSLVYCPGHHQALPNKSQTYSVEADNAELRHYLARLARKSRCFSRCLHALWRAVKLFMFAWNRRQLFKHTFPGYPAHVKDFEYP